MPDLDQEAINFPRTSASFWQYLDQLVATVNLTIDRPKGTPHPRYPDFVYPYDYGYLEGIPSSDGGGLDVWVGSLPGKHATGVICTVDLVKRDVEIKLLLSCTAQEMQDILAVHNAFSQAAVLIER